MVRIGGSKLAAPEIRMIAERSFKELLKGCLIGHGSILPGKCGTPIP
jgi:hypothetical protein